MNPDSAVVLGPIARYVGTDTATLWFEMAEASTVTVVTDTGVRAQERTWGLYGHHFALVALEGLPADSTVHYEVFVDERTVWPPQGRRAAIHTLDVNGPVTLAFGSCRRGDNYSKESLDQIGADALAGLGNALIEQDPGQWPQALLLLGDQVYADDPSPEILERLQERRRSGQGPTSAIGTDADNEICDFEEYSWLYRESWGARAGQNIDGEHPVVHDPRRSRPTRRLEFLGLLASGHRDPAVVERPRRRRVLLVLGVSAPG